MEQSEPYRTHTDNLVQVWGMDPIQLYRLHNELQFGKSYWMARANESTIDNHAVAIANGNVARIQHSGFAEIIKERIGFEQERELPEDWNEWANLTPGQVETVEQHAAVLAQHPETGWTFDKAALEAREALRHFKIRGVFIDASDLDKTFQQYWPEETF